MDELYKIVIIGERELVIGYRLLGCTECYIVNDKEGASKLVSLLSRKDIGIIIASDFIRDYLSNSELEKIEFLTRPLVVFVPSQIKTKKGEEEVLKEIVKRVLGIDIGA
ncbi:MAG: V-type ATP synthase subunit F [Thermoplasmata archaeon]|nr:V-type ATP synthase subunit F [Thermoplasmata archaeon]